jgi:hypothetical protein
MTLLIDSQESVGTGHRVAGSGNPSPLTWSFNNAAGNLLLVLAIATTAPGTASLGAVTYNGVAMTLAVSVSWDSGASVAGLYYLVNPATGSNTVSVSASWTSPNNPAILAGAISFSGANTSGPIGSTSSNSLSSGSGSTTPTAGSITAASGNYVLGGGGSGTSGTYTPNSGQTETFSLSGSNATAGDNLWADYEHSSGSAINLGFTIPQDYWGMVAAEVKAAPASSNANFLAFMGG